MNTEDIYETLDNLARDAHQRRRREVELEARILELERRLGLRPLQMDEPITIRFDEEQNSVA